jgi:hypothetical protein
MSTLNPDIERADWFLYDGQYFPFLAKDGDAVDWKKPAKGVMLRSLWNYDNDSIEMGDNRIIGLPRGEATGQGGGTILEALDGAMSEINRAGPLSPPEKLGIKQITHDSVARDVVAHYTTGEIEVIDYIFDKLGYEMGIAYILANFIKYSSRANHKGQRRSDITKIRNYATIALQKMDKEGELE